MSIHFKNLFILSMLLLAMLPSLSQAETCSQTVQFIDSQHRKALDNYKPGTDEFRRALYTIEDVIFPSMKRCPRNASLLAAMSELQLSLGQPPIALLYAQKALTFDPNSWQAHNAAGNALNVVEKYTQGLQHLQRASQLQPENYALLVNLCSNYEKQKQYNKAIQNCDRVINKGPYDLRGTAYYIRAKAYRARGELMQAESDEKHAKEFGFRGLTGINKKK